MLQPRIVRWSPPSVGQLKLNTDAAVGRYMASGGALVHDSTGSFAHAVSFPLQLDMRLCVKAQTALLAILYYLPRFAHFDIEIDCMELVNIIASSVASLAPDLLRLRGILDSASLRLHYTSLETNMPAHL